MFHVEHDLAVLALCLGLMFGVGVVADVAKSEVRPDRAVCLMWDATPVPREKP